MSPTDLGAALSNSLSLSSILILTALGLAITFGVMRVINMAHGEMLMLGAYTAHLVSSLIPKWLTSLAQSSDLPFLAEAAEHVKEYGFFYAIPVSFLLLSLVGYIMEIGLIRFLYGRPLDTLLATWGVGMILQQTVNLTFGANLQETHLPEMLQGKMTIGEVAVPVYRLVIVLITVLCLCGIYVWFFRTSQGLKIRAVVQNRAMASALGISTRRVDALTFAFATGLAGVAGCIMANLYNVKYNMGNDYIVDAFMVVILGGMGQLSGCVVAGIVVGVGNSVLSKILGALLAEHGAGTTAGNTPETMAKVLVFAVVIVFLLIRPSGLFTVRERTYD